MPMYDFECALCGEAVELVTAYEERDLERVHRLEVADNGCTGQLKRAGVSGFTMGTPTPKMGAVMYQGDQPVGHVKGTFGKEAPRRRKK